MWCIAQGASTSAGPNAVPPVLPTPPGNVIIELVDLICDTSSESLVYKGTMTTGDDETQIRIVAVKVSKRVDVVQGSRLFEIVGTLPFYPCMVCSDIEILPARHRQTLRLFFYTQVARSF
jgi:hypothetical protein